MREFTCRTKEAVSFLDRERMGWLTDAQRDSQRPQTWWELKEVMSAHFDALAEGVHTERLRRVPHINTVQGYLLRFTKAATECSNFLDEEKTNAFVKNLRPETRETGRPGSGAAAVPGSQLVSFAEANARTAPNEAERDPVPPENSVRNANAAGGSVPCEGY